MSIIFRALSGRCQEDFLKYFRDHLSLRLDDLSGVLTVELQAFDPAYGQRG